MNARFKDARKMLHLSQQKFGEKFGVSQNAVSAWERNAKFPHPTTLVEIADACNVSVDWLLGRTSVSTFYRDGEIPPASAIESDTQIAMDAIIEAREKQRLPVTPEELNSVIEAVVQRLLAERGL